MYPEPLKPEVSLISWTKNPLSTVLNVWSASRMEEENLNLLSKDENLSESDLSVFKEIVDMDMPLAEMIDFIFIFDNISVTWREHVVRHRIGSKVGDDIGVDIVPELSSSSFWSQAIRIKDMSHFFDKGQYRIPDSISSNSELKERYQAHIKSSQDLYRELVEKYNIEREDARELFPLGMTHRMSWKLNLASMKKVIGKRSCWIAQATLWQPIIVQMVKELRSKVHPIFGFISNPPCIKKDCYNSCPFHYENRRRMNKQDKVPPCPLWMVYDWEGWEEGKEFWTGIFDVENIESRKIIVKDWEKKGEIHECEVYREKIKLFEELWGRGVHDWSKIDE